MLRTVGLCVLSGLSALMLGGCAADAGYTETDETPADLNDTPAWEIVAPTGKGTGRLASDGLALDEASSDPSGEAKPSGQAGSGNITYHNGPIIAGTTNVYVIWYGDFSSPYRRLLQSAWLPIRMP